MESRGEAEGGVVVAGASAAYFNHDMKTILALFLLAAIGGLAHTVIVETIAMAAFALLAVLGFKRSSWLVVAGLAGHGLFDAVHGLVVANPGVPTWWPAFCATFDVSIAGLLAALKVYQAAFVRDRDGFGAAHGV